MEYNMHPIGTIYTPFTTTEGMPIQSSRSKAIGRAVIDPQYMEGMQDLEGFSHIYLIYIFHCAEGYELRVKPFLDDRLRGLFATRYPCRPNPVGMSIVRLIALRENLLEFEGADMLNGTPLLDIKPYVPDFDFVVNPIAGWYSSRSIR